MLFHNNGDGTFTDVSEKSGIGQYIGKGMGVAFADFNGDGFADLAVANSNCPSFPACGAGTISIILGNGDGTFQGPTRFSTGTDTYPYFVAVGDFNGDKIPDLSVANYATNTVGIMLGVGDGTFAPPVTYDVGTKPTSIAIGDFNSDGKLDLAVANYGDRTITLLLGKGDGTFTQAAGSPYAVGQYPYQLTAADFNGDGKLDLATANLSDYTVSILLQQ